MGVVQYNVIRNMTMIYELRQKHSEHSDCVNLFKLTVGDWSSDGHGMTDEVMILTNKTADQLEYVHKYFFISELMKACSDYEATKLSPELAQAMIDSGVVTEVDLTQNLMVEDYVTLFLDIVKYYLPSFSYLLIEVPYGNSINIGGYGLYSA